MSLFELLSFLFIIFPPQRPTAPVSWCLGWLSYSLLLGLPVNHHLPFSLPSPLLFQSLCCQTEFSKTLHSTPFIFLKLPLPLRPHAWTPLPECRGSYSQCGFLCFLKQPVETASSPVFKESSTRSWKMGVVMRVCMDFSSVLHLYKCSFGSDFPQTL